MIHALAHLLFHPHATAAGAAAEAALAVVRRDLRARHAGHGVQHVARRVVDTVVTAEVAGIGVRDGLSRGAFAQRDLLVVEQLLHERQGVDNFVSAAQLRVFVRDGVEAVRA